MIRISPEVCQAIVAHALRCRPEEACGMVSAAAAGHVVDRFHPLRNEAGSPSRFRLDGAEMLALEQAVSGEGRELVGVVHSHVTTSAWPSPTDIDDAARYDPDGILAQLIVSLRDAEPSLRGFRIAQGIVTEHKIVVFDPAPTAHDQGSAVSARLP